ncbi:unnamed protein product [Caenorhabditis auriculariae]|uniref:ShKT domain-containing protein n=1 Tax=Caenorhabditis auriculariae TaxID=2777116 RepID=A0A8S1H3U7_9PELO|nr:unnamed protein product [Caenorhabditis auriculariae]
MLLTVILVVSIASGATASGETCAAESGPCLSLAVDSTNTVYICPDGQACLNNATCCNFANIQVAGAATTTLAPTTPGGAACVDLLNPSTGVSDCPHMAAYCNNAVYFDLMTQQCPKTCNRCAGGNGGGSPVNPPQVNCVDKLNPSTGVSDCPKSAYLCQNAVYLTLMKDQCPKTCGYC